MRANASWRIVKAALRKLRAATMRANSGSGMVAPVW
jgi:hypothetical protein